MPSATNSVQPGDIAPDFSAVDDQGKHVSLSDFKGRVVVLFFYPKDDTPG
jgi:peroxiredoxin Q/BCP